MNLSIMYEIQQHLNECFPINCSSRSLEAYIDHILINVYYHKKV